MPVPICTLGGAVKMRNATDDLIRQVAGMHAATEHHHTVMRNGRGWACVECDGYADLYGMLYADEDRYVFRPMPDDGLWFTR